METNTAQQWAVDPTTPSLPSPSFFTDPLLLALGLLTGFQAKTAAPMKEAVESTLRVCGLNPADLPNGWVLKDPNKRGLSRKVELSYRNQREEYLPHQTPLTISMGHGQWGLTSEGVARAQALKDGTPVPPTAAVEKQPTLEVNTKAAEEQARVFLAEAEQFATDLMAETKQKIQATLEQAREQVRLMMEEAEGQVQAAMERAEAGAKAAVEAIRLPTPEPKPEPEPKLASQKKQPKTLHPHILAALAKGSKHQAGTPVSTKEISHEVFQRSGYPKEEWREFTTAFHKALKNLETRRVPLVTHEGRGQWSLTNSGLEEFGPKKEVTPEKKSCPGQGPNATALWIEKQGPKLLKYLSIRISKAFPKSVSLGLVDEHLQNYLLRAIHRNSFSKHLDRIGFVRYSTISRWCLNSCKTDFRGWGTKPLMREQCSARTKTEVGNFNPDTVGSPQYVKCTHDTSSLIFSREEDDDGFTMGGYNGNGIKDFVDPRDFTNPSVAMEGDMTFNFAFNTLKSMVRGVPPKAWDRHFRLLAMRSLGFSIKEIAKSEGCKPGQVSKLLKRARFTIQSNLSDEAKEMADQTFRCRRDSGSSKAI